jgi:hypothetical protein
MTEHEYSILTPGIVRREAFWRCSNNPQGLLPSKWTSISPITRGGLGSD